MKYIKFDNSQIPGTVFKSKGRVEKILKQKLKHIRRAYRTLAGRKHLKMQDTKSKLPCISHSCKFEGVRLKRYLRSKCHDLSEKDPEMAESYMRKTFVCCQESTTQSHAKPSKSQQEPSKTQHEKRSQKKQAISITLSSVTH